MSGADEATRSWVEPEEVSAGLLLFAPDDPGPDFADRLGAALAAGGVAAFVTGPPAAASLDWRPARERCREHGVACLALDDPGLARELGADGVHVTDARAVGATRARLGPGALLGASCGGSRHDAMVAGEEGADYVTFSPSPGDPDALPELCRWWTELFVLPCAADLRGAALDAGGPVRAGADFVAVREAVWAHPAGPAEAVLGLRRRVEAGRAERQGSS